MKDSTDEKIAFAINADQAVMAEICRQFLRRKRRHRKIAQLPEKSNFSRNCGNKRIRHQKGNKIIQGVSHAG